MDTPAKPLMSSFWFIMKQNQLLTPHSALLASPLLSFHILLFSVAIHGFLFSNKASAFSSLPMSVCGTWGSYQPLSDGAISVE